VEFIVVKCYAISGGNLALENPGGKPGNAISKSGRIISKPSLS
jgi:hypothetical protein